MAKKRSKHAQPPLHSFGSSMTNARPAPGAAGGGSRSDDASQQGKTVVVGDGWAALGAVATLAPQAGHQIVWLPNSGSRLVPPIASLEAGAGVETWRELLRRWELSAPEAIDGVFLREFRNKSFRPVAWSKSPIESREEVRAEMIWAPEVRLAPISESKIEPNLWAREEELRARVLEAFAAEPARLQRHEGVPVNGLRIVEGGGEGKTDRVTGVILGSGEVIDCTNVIYADRWSTVPALEGLPKGLSLSRRRDPVGVLQAVFTHKSALRPHVAESFYSVLHKDAGEEFERHVWGYFSADGKRSVWSLLLAGEEGEDNHQIARKFRRLKQALDKMFQGQEWLPEGVSEFTANVESEQVRYEEASLFGAGEAPTEPVSAPKLSGLHFLTDGYGPSSSMNQVAILLGVQPAVVATEAEAEAPSAATETPSEEAPQA